MMVKKFEVVPHVAELKESATLAINQKAKQMRKTREIHHFGFGESPFEVHVRIQEALARNSNASMYMPTKGLPELREAISHFYNEHFGYTYAPENIVIGPGSKEVIFLTLLIHNGPVIIPAPSWVSYGPQSRLAKKSHRFIQTRFEDKYKVTPENLRAAIKGLEGQQKILITNSPQNPTGLIYKVDEIKALTEVCRETNTLIIADEIYSLITFEKEKFESFVTHYPEGTILSGGLSKAFSGGGYRLGFVAFPKNLEAGVKAITAAASETYSSVSAPVQFAAVEAYQSHSDVMEYVQNCGQVHRAASLYLYERFKKMGLRIHQPEGGFYVFPDFSPYKEKLKKLEITTCSELCNYLLDNLGIAFLPGEDFFMAPDVLAVRVATVDYDPQKALAADGNFDMERDFPSLVKASDKLEAFLKSL